jgi:hypothetical protein
MGLRLVLQYSRSMRDGGKVSGRVVHVNDKDAVVNVADQFDKVEFSQMLRIFSNYVKADPGMTCGFQRIDKPGFPITEWAPVHVEQLRNDPEQAIAELSTVRTVTYDMRKKEQE